jgi:hypothetical protein
MLSPQSKAETMDDNPEFSSPPGSSTVQLIEACGEWFVRIVEDGKQAPPSSFDAEGAALAYAEAERVRLGLARIELN